MKNCKSCEFFKNGMYPNGFYGNCMCISSKEKKLLQSKLPVGILVVESYLDCRTLHDCAFWKYSAKTEKKINQLTKEYNS